VFDLISGLASVEPIIRTAGNPTLRLVHSCPLLHYGDCALIGVDAHGHCAIEEYYDDWLAQYVFDSDGHLVALCDEDEGRAIDPTPIPDHDLFIAPPPVGHAAVLNYIGARWRGLREEDRIIDMAAPLSVPEKMALGRLGIPSPIIGLSESYVLAEAQITDTLSVIIRRLRVAFAVPPNEDESGDLYDYDSIPIYIAQWFNRESDAAPLDQGVIALGTRPMDAQHDGNRLYIADAGEFPRIGALHIYQIED
jgi:hypothetical protein